ncbi:MAG: hypothetical protein KDC35_09310 [Acidobacteria bacterium]|nr:hypothetical protein [Acidobacteriota bacterium]
MSGSLWALYISTSLIAALHALAPDHWIPLVQLSTAQGWPSRKRLWMTVLAGMGHVGGSVLIGCVGVLLGISLSQAAWFENQRGFVAGLLLIGFGLAYTVWGWRNLADRGHHTRRRFGAALVLTLVLGPCEPLIPLMFLAYAFGWFAIIGVGLLFGVITIAMMVSQVSLASLGIERGRRLKHLLSSHVTTGFGIVITGLAVMLLGL